MPRRLAIRAAAALVAAAAAVTIAGCSGSGGGSGAYQFSTATPNDTVIPAGSRDPAEPIGGSSLAGNGNIDIARFRGQVLVMNFFASWCAPCKAETPQFVDAYRALHDKGVAFVGVDTTDLRTQGRAFVALYHVPYPVIYDQQGQVQLTLGNIPGRLPFTVLVDKRGRVAAVYLGALTAKDLTGPITTLRHEPSGHVT